jgi:RES domain-containing protein
MRAFRLSRKKYAYQLNGIGASKFWGRWNTKATKLIYTAANRALKMAELAVHLNLTWLPRDYMMVEIDIPNEMDVDTIKPGKLPDN